MSILPSWSSVRDRIVLDNSFQFGILYVEYSTIHSFKSIGDTVMKTTFKCKCGRSFHVEVAETVKKNTPEAVERRIRYPHVYDFIPAEAVPELRALFHGRRPDGEISKKPNTFFKYDVCDILNAYLYITRNGLYLSEIPESYGNRSTIIRYIERLRRSGLLRSALSIIESKISTNLHHSYIDS